MHHLRSRILMLAIAGVGDRQDFTRCAFANEVHRRVLHGELRANVAVDPFHVAMGLNTSTLGHQVVHVWRPVLNRRVRNPSMGLHHDFDNRGVQ